ncbi:hypothetical protein VTK73DRAFT_6322 [Phialemonium thermophilum]|uniref:Uncharacterized protein n=1 Tax=Phialemonium thermophilum TaxID=223376 RepID=A0ABR3WJY6_9PEZI
MANQRGNLSPKALVAPLAAFTMAWVLFAYTRSSIQAAKVNAVSLNLVMLVCRVWFLASRPHLIRKQRMKRSAAEDERSEGSRS